MTRSRDLSAVQNNLGVAIPPAAAGKNAVINGGFDIWQRGTSISLAASTSTANGYNADRWDTASGANQALTVSRQATGDTTNLPNIQYCARYQRNSGQTGTGQLFLWQSFESANSIPFAGKTITLSFYARAGANFSASSNTLYALIYYGTGTDQNIGNGYTGGANTYTSFTLTTTWQRFTFTTTIPSTSTEIGPAFSYVPTGTAGANDYFEVTGVQLELGSSATPFSRNGATIQGELAACQRYFYAAVNLTNTTMAGVGQATTTAAGQYYNKYPVTMRVAPTLTLSSASHFLVTTGNGGSGGSCTSISLALSLPDFGRFDASTGGTSLTVGQGSVLQSQSASAQLWLSSEL